MSAEKPDRLFVPLTAEAFGWWKSGIKHWEVRLWTPRWLLPHTRIGRRVELRLGYSGGRLCRGPAPRPPIAALWGTITGRRSGQMSYCLAGLPISALMPGQVAEGWLEMCARLAKIIGSAEDDNPHVVAFEVLLDPGQGVGG